MHSALLWVLMETGPNASLEEFHDWYNNEHVPLRMSTLKEFETGARYEAIDGLSPRWSAIYEVSDPILFSQDKYTKLRANRSPREAELMSRLAVVDRRTYTELLHDSSKQPPRGSAAAAPYLVTIASKERPADVEANRRVHGWTRTHTYKLGDSLLTGQGKTPTPNLAAAFVTVHEFSSEHFADDAGFKSSLPEDAEVRRWKLYRAWDNAA